MINRVQIHKNRQLHRCLYISFLFCILSTPSKSTIHFSAVAGPSYLNNILLDFIYFIRHAAPNFLLSTTIYVATRATTIKMQLQSIPLVVPAGLVMARPTPQAKARKPLDELVAEGRAKGLKCNLQTDGRMFSFAQIVLASTGMFSFLQIAWKEF